MFRRSGLAMTLGLALAAGLLAGCGTVSGPGLAYTSPRVTGRVVDDASGAPLRNARVGRRLWTNRDGTGGYLKAGELMVLAQDYTRTDADGSFNLPGRRVALLLSFGEVGLNLDLAVQRGGYHPWLTNYPLVALSTNSDAPLLEAGDLRLKPR